MMTKSSERPKRRRAVLINEVDQKLLAEGKKPSWLDVDEHPRVEDSSVPGEIRARQTVFGGRASALVAPEIKISRA